MAKLIPFPASRRNPSKGRPSPPPTGERFRPLVAGRCQYCHKGGFFPLDSPFSQRFCNSLCRRKEREFSRELASTLEFERRHALESDRKRRLKILRILPTPS